MTNKYASCKEKRIFWYNVAVRQSIVEITTKDNFVHQGLFFKPAHPKKKAILWIHGLTDNFYGDINTLETFAEVCDKLGWGVASFNNRGHDIVTSIAKVDENSPKSRISVTAGAGVEKFTDCVYDIEAGITFLEKHGFSEVILVGISTGANKACYHTAKAKDPRVAGVVLASAISDVAIKQKELGNRYEETIKKVKKLVKEGKGETLINDFDYMPLTPNRFLSLYDTNGPEDTFPYYQKNPKFTAFSKITKPLMVIMGGGDEYSERPVAEIVKTYKKYQKSSNFISIIIPGAFHSFGGKEKEFVEEVVNWIKSI